MRHYKLQLVSFPKHGSFEMTRKLNSKICRFRVWFRIRIIPKRLSGRNYWFIEQTFRTCGAMQMRWIYSTDILLLWSNRCAKHGVKCVFRRFSFLRILCHLAEMRSLDAKERISWICSTDKSLLRSNGIKE